MASEYGDLIAHWWNGQWGWARKDIWVHRQGDRWHILWCARLDHADMFKRLNTSEAVARAYVERLIEIAPVPPPREDWRDIAATHRTPRPAAEEPDASPSPGPPRHGPPAAE